MANRLHAVWEDGGQEQVGKAITITDHTGATATLYQADGVTTVANPVNTVLRDNTAVVDVFVANPGQYHLTGPDGTTQTVTVAASGPQSDIPIVTGSRGANAALQSLLTALAGQGRIIDHTTV